MHILRQFACMIVSPIMVETLLPSLIARWWVGPQLLLQSVSDGWHLTINICGKAHRGLVCIFLVFWLQIAIDPFAGFLLICASL